ncbi:hypothetical protein S40285_05010 [Stachybotrys chlorohalonatus IBT 40285]|uniref:Asteroid domain-containing protein n=1 Tax=Stachybotrys chlorohalonatus (strain IBT 40285) TaxID=1283841 RepID=A0A084QFJ5_STAC4|nr:hypothetical protein S40285_05010 [Stachybotrys chlorohalonata IBT 40285]
MGIPNLISTLEPYAEHSRLRGEHVVIDGPALAYNMLRICRGNGAYQPSHGLLGRAVLAWLDKLAACGVTIEALYFDGYLPAGKLSVRMQRTLKSSSQMSQFFSLHRQTFPRVELSSDDGDVAVYPFSNNNTLPQSKFTPVFLVPAVIDALLQSPRYRDILHLVPGEADAFCAQHVSQHGGIVLTSDSDLLVHTLGEGKVAFLPDVSEDADGEVICALFDPSQISRRLHIPPEGFRRLAYERKHSPHLSLGQLLQECFQAVSNEAEYQRFCREYEKHESCTVPRLHNESTLQLRSFDPRISEVVLQLGQDSNPNGVRMFLPILLESPPRGSAWEASLYIRQLAYTVARWAIPGATSSVLEFRKIQTLDQKGRSVDMLSKSSADALLSDLVGTMRKLRESTNRSKQYYWVLLYLVLDIRDRQAQEKQSHSLAMLQNERSWRSPSKSANMSWDFAHFISHLQATYYSLRILAQTLSIYPERGSDGFPSSILELRRLLFKMPSLADSPSLQSVETFFKNSDRLDVLSTLADFVHVTLHRQVENENRPTTTKKRLKARGKTSQIESIPVSLGGNAFGILSVDE